ncbi:MAG: Ig-like domain-containing protein [Exilispira sp.]|nr:Ig-like domain-containing protein [Exilispira sp.]
MKKLKKSICVVLFCILIVFSGCTVELFSNFEVILCTIEDNGIIGTNFQQIKVDFSQDINSSDIYNYITVQKDGGGAIEISCDIYEKSIIITPLQNWIPHQRYWLKISSEFESKKGKKLEKNFYRVFQSTAEIIPVSCILINQSIIDGVIIDEVNSLSFRFSNDVNRISVESAFLISPDIKGYFEWISNSEFIYHLTSKLIANSSYKISITKNAKDNNNLPIKEFSGNFDYHPDELIPEITAIRVDGTIKEVNDTNCTYENGIYYLDCICDKDSIIGIQLNKAFDNFSVRDSISISPDVSWVESCNNLLNIIFITFESELKLDEYYTISISKNIKDLIGLTIKKGVVIRLHVCGNQSQFLQLLPNSIDQMGILASQGTIPLTISYENISEGVIMNVGLKNETDPVDPVDFEIPLTFINAGYSDHILNAGSVLKSIFIKKLFPGSESSISISSYDINSNKCTIKFSLINPRFGAETIFLIKILGGSSGILDNYKNYLKETIMIYFKMVYYDDSNP